jgi:hypothetical protein
MNQAELISSEKLKPKNQTLKTSFFKNLFVSAGYTYVAHGLTFLSSMVNARLLTPENYGLVGLITVFTGFIAVFVDSGISLAVIKSDYGLLLSSASEIKAGFRKALSMISPVRPVGLHNDQIKGGFKVQQDIGISQ